MNRFKVKIVSLRHPMGQGLSEWSSNMVFGLACVAVAGRLLPHPANVTPVGGLAVWGGSRLSLKRSLAVVIGSMALTDLFLGFHTSMLQVYLTLAATVVAAHWLKPKTVLQVTGFTVASAMVFFLITNLVFFPWTFHLYPATLAGQAASYSAALPFLRNSLLGDLGYVTVFYGAEAMLRRLTRLETRSSNVIRNV